MQERGANGVAQLVDLEKVSMTRMSKVSMRMSTWLTLRKLLYAASRYSSCFFGSVPSSRWQAASISEAAATCLRALSFL